MNNSKKLRKKLNPSVVVHWEWHIIRNYGNPSQRLPQHKNHAQECVLIFLNLKSPMQGRRKVWKSGGGACSNVVCIIWPLKWNWGMYLPKSGGKGQLPPLPPCSNGPLFKIKGASSQHQQHDEETESRDLTVSS